MELEKSLSLGVCKVKILMKGFVFLWRNVTISKYVLLEIILIEMYQMVTLFSSSDSPAPNFPFPLAGNCSHAFMHHPFVFLKILNFLSPQWNVILSFLSVITLCANYSSLWIVV